MKNRIKKTGIIILCLSIGLILHSACKGTSATIRTNTGKNDVAEILAKETQSTEPQSTEPESPRPSGFSIPIWTEKICTAHCAKRIFGRSKA